MASARSRAKRPILTPLQIKRQMAWLEKYRAGRFERAGARARKRRARHRRTR